MKRIPCIGGPLNGKRVTQTELQTEQRHLSDFRLSDGTLIHKRGDIFRTGGCYSDVGKEYLRYNSAGGAGPSSVWLHKGLLDIRF